MKGKSDTIRVRMAPSPTGPLHIGTARTALFNWLYARKNNGTFILRSEDTDTERSKKEYEDDLIDGLTWLGIAWDDFARQSERKVLYRTYLETLLKNKDAYYCYCTKDELEAQRQALLASGLPPKYNGHCRDLTSPPSGREPQVIRFKIPEIKVEFKDVVRGKVVFDAALFGDQVIAKDLDTPLYNFAVVVDDADMKISHVIRGEDHLSNTPKQILIQRALGFTEPIYAHIPLILNPDRSKMSKRFSDTTLKEYRAQGYLPIAMMNFLSLLGWHPKDDREVFQPDELIEAFELERVQKAGAVFNQEKLDWLNREHMKLLSDAELTKLVRPFLPEKFAKIDDAFLERLVAVERTRANTLRDFAELGSFFFALPDYESSLLIWKETPLQATRETLEHVHSELLTLNDANFHRETLSSTLSLLIGEGNRGTVLWPLRVAVSGLRSSPDPIEIMDVIGKHESLARIQTAIEKLSR
jgi:glutamyl-tRNA synthetase